MKKIQWIRILYIIGIVAMIIGAIDPLEGSVVIFFGSLCITVSTIPGKQRYWKIFLGSSLMILTGMVFLFLLSSLGGFGGNSKLSWWWSILILPYPIGWLIAIVFIIIRAIKNKKGSV